MEKRKIETKSLCGPPGLHYACRNADLNFTRVTGTTNGFIFQIIDSLIEYWGVRLTCLDCKGTKSFALCDLKRLKVSRSHVDFIDTHFKYCK